MGRVTASTEFEALKTANTVFETFLEKNYPGDAKVTVVKCLGQREPVKEKWEKRLDYHIKRLFGTISKVLIAEQAGMLIGRDDSIELSVRSKDLASFLGMLPRTGEETQSDVNLFWAKIRKEA